MKKIPWLLRAAVKSMLFDNQGKTIKLIRLPTPR